jgi:hypothetical protein
MAHPVPPVLEAIAALSMASGHLRELEREDVAHRCDTAAARLQLLVDEYVEQEDDATAD